VLHRKRTERPHGICAQNRVGTQEQVFGIRPGDEALTSVALLSNSCFDFIRWPLECVQACSRKPMAIRLSCRIYPWKNISRSVVTQQLLLIRESACPVACMLSQGAVAVARSWQLGVCRRIGPPPVLTHQILHTGFCICVLALHTAGALV
jgi:hypothetical protein